jgi:Lon protease-like protein
VIWLNAFHYFCLHQCQPLMAETTSRYETEARGRSVARGSLSWTAQFCCTAAPRARSPASALPGVRDLRMKSDRVQIDTNMRWK